jgi:putative MFS transporter
MDGPVATPRARNPWWIPPFLGRVPPEITPAQLRLLGFIALAMLFENYDLSMLGSAIKYIREDFGLPQSEVGRLTATVRLGALPALFVIPFVDRIGRRRVFLASVLGMSLGTLATAFTQSEWQFVAVQMVSRTFLVTASATAFVIVSEELPATRRGWGVGMLGALGAFGFGLGALLFAAIDWLPFGWRFLYAVGVVPLLLVPRFRREVTETRRFARSQGEGEDLVRALGRWLDPLRVIVRRHPGRAVGIALLGGLAAGGHASGFQIMGDYLLTDRGWEPWRYSALFILGGLFGIVGNPAAGRLGDRYGRRVVGSVVLAIFPLFMYVFYHSDGWMIPLAWIPGVFALSGGATVIRAFSTELFPTASRGTATGWLMLLETAGAALALAALTRLTPEGESVVPAVTTLVFLTLGAALVVLMLPETANLELEEISAEERPPTPS